MDQMKILKIRAMILDECQRQVFDALVWPLSELHMTEEEEKAWILNARSYSGQLEWESYSTTRDSFMMKAYDLLSIMGDAPV